MNDLGTFAIELDAIKEMLNISENTFQTVPNIWVFVKSLSTRTVCRNSGQTRRSGGSIQKFPDAHRDSDRRSSHSPRDSRQMARLIFKRSPQRSRRMSTAIVTASPPELRALTPHDDSLLNWLKFTVHAIRSDF
jgi:hypothetical protein